MRGITTIVKKEINRVFSDKKLIFSLFILPVLIIFVMYSIMGKMSTSMQDDINAHVPSVFLQNAPEDFPEYMKSVNFAAEIKTVESDSEIDTIKDDILNGNSDLLVVFEDGFMDKINNYNDGDAIPEVKTYYNPSADYSNTARETFVSSVLANYKQELLGQRIGNLEKIAVFNIDVDQNSSMILDEKKASGKVFGMILPYLITFLLFTGVMSIGIDAVTGEKERGTMASMLLTPLKRSEIAFGKIIAIAILSSISAAVYAIGMIVSMPIMMKDMMGAGEDALKLSISPAQIVQLLIVMLVLVFFYVTIVTLVAVIAKTAKEANAYVMPIYMVVLVAGMITMFAGDKAVPTGFYAIPVYGSAICIKDLLVGELNWMNFGINAGGTVVLTLILVAVITKAFNSEKVMFNA